jgi:spore germination cell wall hydrolase CwlJ-like protein
MWKLILTALIVLVIIDQFAVKTKQYDVVSRPLLVKEEVLNITQNVSYDPVDMLDQDDVFCMTQNIYFEARNQSRQGKYAVAEVVMNRVRDERFPKSVCEVIKEESEKNCQFSWYCDGKTDRMDDIKAYREARKIAVDVLTSEEPTDYTGGAIFYHADYVEPNWNNVKETVVIDEHIFYASL